jgi:hypothetical protein
MLGSCAHLEPTECSILSSCPAFKESEPIGLTRGVLAGRGRGRGEGERRRRERKKIN